MKRISKRFFAYSKRHQRRLLKRQTNGELRRILDHILNSPPERYVSHPPAEESDHSEILSATDQNMQEFDAARNTTSASQEQWQWRHVEDFMDDTSSVHSYDYPPSISSDDEDDLDTKEEKFVKEVEGWMRSHTVSREACNALLCILNSYTSVRFPVDSRSILKTPKNTNIVSVCQGQYWHSGFEKAIIEVLRKREHLSIHDEFVNMYVNVDGVPLGKSAIKCLWPILCSDNIIKDADVIGIYFGERKPDNSNDFLDRFVKEAVKLINEGVTYKNKLYNVRIIGLVCDVPAKSYIMQVSGHAGYKSCTKCCIDGTYLENTLCFPGICERKRTDEEFANNSYASTTQVPDYQRGVTCLAQIPYLGLVSNVPLDYMHLVCLGVMRKLIQLWIKGPINKNVRLPTAQVNQVSEHLLALSGWIPKDFNRKPRPLMYHKYWKATELRSFLLYFGPVVLRKVLRIELYNHFLLLHVAITILVSPVLSSVHANVIHAEQLLNYFVSQFESLHGKRYISHNVHNLRHLADDVKTFGALDEFGAFRFENCIGILAKMVKKGELPLQQIHRKITTTKKFSQLPKINYTNGIKLSSRHRFGVLPRQGHRFSAQYQIMEKDNYVVSIKDTRNNCVLLVDGTVVEVINFARMENKAFVIGKKYGSKRNLYTSPIASSSFCINVVKSTNDNQFWSCTDVIGKMIKLPYKNDNEYAVFPILHTFS